MDLDLTIEPIKETSAVLAAQGEILAAEIEAHALAVKEQNSRETANQRSLESLKQEKAALDFRTMQTQFEEDTQENEHLIELSAAANKRMVAIIEQWANEMDSNEDMLTIPNLWQVIRLAVEAYNKQIAYRQNVLSWTGGPYVEALFTQNVLSEENARRKYESLRPAQQSESKAMHFRSIRTKLEISLRVSELPQQAIKNAGLTSTNAVKLMKMLNLGNGFSIDKRGN